MFFCHTLPTDQSSQLSADAVITMENSFDSNSLGTANGLAQNEPILSRVKRGWCGVTVTGVPRLVTAHDLNGVTILMPTIIVLAPATVCLASCY